MKKIKEYEDTPTPKELCELLSEEIDEPIYYNEKYNYFFSYYYGHYNNEIEEKVTIKDGRIRIWGENFTPKTIEKIAQFYNETQRAKTKNKKVLTDEELSVFDEDTKTTIVKFKWEETTHKYRFSEEDYDYQVEIIWELCETRSEFEDNLFSSGIDYDYLGTIEKENKK